MRLRSSLAGDGVDDFSSSLLSLSLGIALLGFGLLLLSAHFSLFRCAAYPPRPPGLSLLGSGFALLLRPRLSLLLGLLGALGSLSVSLLASLSHLLLLLPVLGRGLNSA